MATATFLGPEAAPLPLTTRPIEKALMPIESRLRCDFGADDARAELDAGQSVDLTDTPLEPGVQSADVRVTWHDPESGFEVEEIDVIRDDDVVTHIGPEDIQSAHRTCSSSARVSGRRARGFRTLHIRRLPRRRSATDHCGRPTRAPRRDGLRARDARAARQA